MEYVVLAAQHPRWFSLHLPNEVAELLRFRPSEVRDLRPPARSVLFLSRGPGIVRAVGSLTAADLLPLETVRNRFIAPAAVSSKGIFNLPGAVARHLGLQTSPRGDGEARGTDDQLVWFLPAPEYYEFRAHQRLGRAWNGPADGVLAHVYLRRAILPMEAELAKLEAEIEAEEWRPRLEALARGARARRAARSAADR